MDVRYDTLYIICRGKAGMYGFKLSNHKLTTEWYIQEIYKNEMVSTNQKVVIYRYGYISNIYIYIYMDI